ncbi:MAG: proline dehydrogenase family protein [Bacteroidales bacterium]|nr:proline dehydrogenase family protein [Bacteroidales bacterium]
MLSFENTEIAFKWKTTGELRKAKIMFSLVSNPLLVKVGKDFVELLTDLQFPVKWALKPTIFSHFCGGETLKDCESSVEKLSTFGVKTILDYSVESKENEEEIQAAIKEIIRSIRNASVKKDLPFAVFKPTALANTNVLKKISMGIPLEKNEQNEADLFEERVNKLCATAYEFNIPILIDAEDYWFQKAIDEVVTKMMLKYNKEKAIVYNTLQMYRKDRLAFLIDSIKHARDNNYFYGVKFVRGAYMEKERARALSGGYLSPIHDCKEDTDSSFNDALKITIENINNCSIFCGTHNEESCYYLAKLMQENNIENSDERIWFSQLYGMSDHISFNLAHNSYNVAKYMPYGPLENVLPYLMRRAEENTSVAGQTGRELSLLKKELERRRTS